MREYFEWVSKKVKEGAIQQGRVDVATANTLGNIGMKEREGAERKATSKIEV